MKHLDEIRQRLHDAERITVLTGAGVSAASGVPTFRGAGGLWRQHRPEQLATPQAFARDPRLVWEWYAWRRDLIAACEPNPAHHVIAQWSRRPGFTLVTQNVDGLHERAGTEHVIRYHGSLWTLRCTRCCGQPDWDEFAVPLDPLPPHCPACGALARPGVVWFGEPIPNDVQREAERSTTCDVFLSIGTSSVVYPAAALVSEARARGAFTIEINPDATPARVDLCVAMAAETALPLLMV